MNSPVRAAGLAAAVAGMLVCTAASANPFLLFSFPFSLPGDAVAPTDTVVPRDNEVLPGDDAASEQPRFQRQIVEYRTSEPAGTVIIDTPNTYLYFVLGNGRAVRYGIGVGRDGFTWSGTQNITRKAEWPDWTPPVEMVHRQPYLPRFVAGGPNNPMGARALYLGGTVYRIHGTNQPETIGGRVSSGCIRMVNDDVIDLYGRVHVGTKVIVLPARERRVDSTLARRG